MCIIVDTSALSPVFNQKDVKHARFRSVLQWIVQGRGKLVYGGSRYRNELRQAGRYFRLFAELKRNRKVIEVKDVDVDKAEQRAIDSVNDTKFDDPHLVGIVVVSGCKLVCTDDRRSIPFLKRRELFPNGISRPKIYTGARTNELLLCDENIAEICKPVFQMAKELRDLFSTGVDEKK